MQEQTNSNSLSPTDCLILDHWIPACNLIPHIALGRGLVFSLDAKTVSRYLQTAHHLHEKPLTDSKISLVERQ